jgi:ornithine cyclodeaminase/alanine dehydrogenase-like protein (mu-crystallin family)
MVLFLRENDIKSLLTMDDAIEAVEHAFRLQGLGQADNLPRQRPRTERSELHVNSSAVSEMGLGLKAATVGSRGVRFVVLLWNEGTGDLEALMEAGWMGQLRTGAASGLATRYMARADATSVGMLGCGKQAWSQLLALSRVRDIQNVWVYSPTPKNREAFAQEMSRKLDISVEAMKTPQDVIVRADIIVTITRARTPLFESRWVRPGTHINAAGSNRAQSQEIDAELIKRASIIAVDDKEQGRIESGDLIAAIREGALKWDDVVELGQIVAGQTDGRGDDDEITLFESLGVGIEDVAVARRAYEKALEQGVGTLLPSTMLG